MRIFVGLIIAALASAVPANAQETAHAIIACKLNRVDPKGPNSGNPQQLPLLEPRWDFGLVFTANGNDVDLPTVRVFDPGHIFQGRKVGDIKLNPQTRAITVWTKKADGDAISLVLSPPEQGKASVFALATRVADRKSAQPFAYLFNGRCALLPTRNPAADFDKYVEQAKTK